MAVTSAASGTQTATVNAEHTLATKTDVGVYVLVVDLGNLVVGDELELRLKTKALSGGTSRLAYMASFGPQVPACLVTYSIPVPIDTEIVATLKQTAGTSRDFPWNLLKM